MKKTKEKMKSGRISRMMISKKRWLALLSLPSLLIIVALAFSLQKEGKNEAGLAENSPIALQDLAEQEEPLLKHEPKLLLLGIDGATWRFMDPLMAEGKMPNLKFLVDNGVRATPPTLNPTISPAIWTTVATGVTPQKHGVNNFISISEETYEQQLITSDDRRVKALWNILSDAGMRVGVFSYWATWPPEVVNGYNVTERALFDQTKGVYPQDLAPFIGLTSARILGLSAITEGLSIRFPEPESPNDPEFFKLAHQQMVRLGKLVIGNSLALFQKEKPDALIQISGVVDATQHLFLKFSWPEEYPDDIDPALLEEYGNFVEKQYIAHDEMIGEYLKLAGPNTHILVMSDHGVFIDPATGYRVNHFNGILEQLGLLQFKENGQIDFENTIAFECNNNTFDWQRRLCINLQGKFASGAVPQSEFESRREEVIKKLNTLKTRSGQSIFLSVEKSQKQEADIEYDLRRDLLEEEVVINGSYVPFREYMNLTIESGHHYSDPVGPPGVFIWYGPNLKKGYEIKTLDIVDVFPNLLHVLGLPVPKDIDGVYLPELFQSPSTPTYINSYEEEFNRVYSGSHERLESKDQFTIEGTDIYLHSDLPWDDDSDQFCFEYPTQEKLALKVLRLEQSPYIDINYTPWDNPKVTKALELFREVNFESLKRSERLVYNPEDISYQSGEGLYRLQSSLDLQEPSSVGIWTDMSFYVKSPGPGVMRLVARGVPAGGEYPIIEVLQNNVSITQVEIESDDYQFFDIPITARAPIELRYINDDLIDGQDRNLHVQRIKFLTEDETPFEPIDFFVENEEFCFINQSKGTLEAHLQIYPRDDASGQNNDIENTIIELLQNTGEIKEE